MKKRFCLMLAVLLAAGALASCAARDTETPAGGDVFFLEGAYTNLIYVWNFQENPRFANGYQEQLIIRDFYHTGTWGTKRVSL